jgi:hypothetical protein
MPMADSTWPDWSPSVTSFLEHRPPLANSRGAFASCPALRRILRDRLRLSLRLAREIIDRKEVASGASGSDLQPLRPRSLSAC